MLAKRFWPAGTIAVGISLFTAASSISGSSASPEFRFIKSGPVSQNGDEFTLVGRFMVSPDNAGVGIENRSHGSGGACIVGDLAKLGAPELTCTSSAVCLQAWSAYYQANLGDPNFDAAAFGAVGNGACIQGRCWYRPGTQANLCQRSPTPWAIGVHEIKPPKLQHVANFFGANSKIDWQVLACANRAQPNGTDALSCSQSAGIYDPPIQATVEKNATDWESRMRLPPVQ